MPVLETIGKRIFKIDGKAVNDPDPRLSVEEVRNFMINTYPELLNANISEGEINPDNGEITYTFEKRIGHKS